MLNINVVELKMRQSRWGMRRHGLEARLVELDDGSRLHCWLPLRLSPLKKGLLLLHGFGGDATIGWEDQVPSLSTQYNLFIPDLLFFGQSTTTSNKRTEYFQAECIYAMMEKLGARPCIVCGHSYGGFVAYRMAHLYPNYVERVIIISSGILMDATTTNIPLLEKFGASRIEDVLIPQNALDFKKTLSFIFHKLPWIYLLVLTDLFELLRGDQQRKLELLDGVVIGKKDAPPIPKLDQDVLIIWGDQDQVFNVDLAYKMKEFLNEQATLAIIKNVGHMPHMENSKEVNRSILEFLSP